MKIKTKVLLIVTACVLGLYFAGGSLLSAFFFGFVRQQEQKDLAVKCGNAVSCLMDQASRLTSTLNDWAKWDETYSFVETPDSRYIRQNLGADSISNLGVEFMSFYSNAAGLSYQFYLDPASQEYTPFPPKLSESIRREFLQGGVVDGSSRIIYSRNSFYLVCCATVTDSLEMKEPNGFLVMGRKLGRDLLANMDKMTDSTIYLLQTNAVGAGILDKLKQPSALQDGSRMVTIAKNNERIVVYSLPDQSGPLSGIVLMLECGREIYKTGYLNHVWMLCLFLAILVVMIALLMLSLEIFVTKPVIRLIDMVSNISLSTNRSARLAATGGGELKRLCGSINGMLEKIETEYKEREYISYHDQLTGLFNRRYCEEAMRLIDTPENLPLSVIIGDLNGLKFTNDAFGHQTGDVLLVSVSEVLKRQCGAASIISRWGGDEFAILLPEIGLGDAAAICARIRNEISKIEINSILYSISLGYETKTAEDDDLRMVLQRAEDYMYRRKMTENFHNGRNAIQAMLTTFKERNAREREHSDRVGQLCRRIGESMGFSEEQAADIEIAGLVHDIGKIAISDSIIDKPGKLTDAERFELRRHPEIGCRILCASNEMLEIAGFVLSHHERWDGLGYPKGLSGECIPLQSRILSVADSYDAITSERPYKPKMDMAGAVVELERCAGTQFDPRVVRAFIDKVLRFKPGGAAVAAGRTAVEVAAGFPGADGTPMDAGRAAYPS